METYENGDDARVWSIGGGDKKLDGKKQRKKRQQQKKTEQKKSDEKKRKKPNRKKNSEKKEMTEKINIKLEINSNTDGVPKSRRKYL